ncbi:hypothetical protein ABPG74_004751 [Tetrahymena malaccensis]
MSQQTQKVTIERRNQVLQSFIQTNTRGPSDFSPHPGAQGAQYDSQVISLIDQVINFVKVTFLSSKQNFAVLVLLTLYFFSNWSITLQNNKGFSIEIVDVLFIVLLVIIVKCWLSGEGLTSIFDLISIRTQQVMNLTSQGLNQNGQFQHLFRFVSSMPANARNLESIEQLFDRYNKEKFQLSEQAFLDTEIVNQLTPQAEQKLKVLIQEYQSQFDKEVPFNFEDIDFNSLPADVTTEQAFRTKVLEPHYEALYEYVFNRYGFDYRNQGIQSSSVQGGSFTNTLPSLAADLAGIEKELLLNRSLTIFAYGNNKRQRFSNRLASFVNEDSQKKIEEFRQRVGGSDESSEQVEVIFGQKDRQEVELKKFVNAPSGDKNYDNLEALTLADKLLERQAEVKQEAKAFKKHFKKTVSQNAQSHQGALNSIIEAEENNPESEVSKSEPEEAIKKLDQAISNKIEELAKAATYFKFEPKTFENYFDNAQEQLMRSESNSQLQESGRKSISDILKAEITAVLEAQSKEELSLLKYLEVVTKYEYFADQYKDQDQVLTRVEESFQNYISNTFNVNSQKKQTKRFKKELTSFKEKLLQEYLLRRLKKQLAEMETQSNELKHQVSKLTEKSDLKDRKIGLLEEQVEALQTQLKEISERLGVVEITYEEEKQALIRDVDAKKKQIEELYNKINNITASNTEKEVKPEPVQSQPITQEEIELRKTTSYNASISILEKSVRNITEIFYDKFRNTAYFSQQELIEKLKQKFGAGILTQGELNQDQKDFIIKEFEDKFMAAEEHFLTKNFGSENSTDVNDKNKKNQKSILDSLDKNFDLLKQRLSKARDISDIQQLKMSDQDERDANKIVDDLINGALTDPDEVVNRQLIALKKIMLKYKQPATASRGSMDQSLKTKSTSKENNNNPNQRVKQKIESTLQYIQENMQNIKGQMKNYLSEDMRRTLKSKIGEWKKSQEDKLEVMKKWSLQSQNMWFTLIWHDSNDLDLVVKCPCGQKIYYGTKKCEQCGTYLEIDMNAGGNKNDKFPVEHIYLQKPPKVGSNWEVYCKMFHCNNNKESPYTVQIEHEDGRIVSYQGTLDINDNPQSPIYKYSVGPSIDENEKKLIGKIRNVIDSQEQFVFF